MINEEINELLSNFENDLFDFVKFVNNVEEEQNKVLSKAEAETRDTKKEPKSGVDVYNNYALPEAFEITKKVLKRTCSLLEQFPLLEQFEERPPSNIDSFCVNYYYDQYIYQIVTNLINILEDNLNKFSENLNQMSFPRMQEEVVNSSPSISKKLPVACTFKHLKPATLFTPDCQIFDPFRTFNDQQLKLKACSVIRNLPEPALEYPLSNKHRIASDEENNHRNFEGMAYDLLNKLYHSLNHLTPLLESISLHLKEFARTQHFQSTPCSTSSQSSYDDTEPLGFGAKPMKACCPEFCKKCCRKCTRTHAASKFKWDYQKPFKDIVPTPINAEPMWMRLNPVASNNHKHKDVKLKDRIDHGQKTVNHRKHTHTARQKSDEKISGNPDKGTSQDLEKGTEGIACIPQRLYPPLCSRWVHRIVDRRSVHPFDDITSDSDSMAEFKLLGSLYKILKSNEKKIPACCRPRKYHDKGQLRPRTRFHKHKVGQAPQLISEEEDNEKQLTASKLQSSESSSSEEESEIETKRNGVKIPPSINNKRAKERETEEPDAKLDKTLNNFVDKVIDVANKMVLVDRDDRKDNPIQVDSETLSEVVVSDEESSSDSEPKPLFAKQLVDKIGYEKESREKIKGFYLLPPKEETTDSGLDKGGMKHFPSYSMSDNDVPSKIIPPDKARFQHKRVAKIKAEHDFEDKRQMDANNLVKTVSDVAAKLASTDKSEKQSILSEEERDILNKIQNVTVFSTGSRVSHGSIGIMIENVSPKIAKNTIKEACSSCRKLLDPLMTEATDFSSRKYMKKLRGSQVMEDTCFRCWNGCQRALAIHRCHNKLPPGVLEVRHMSKIGKICVCFLFLDLRMEKEDWRWLKNPFQDQTRVEIQQKAGLNEDTQILIVYGPEHTLVKESLGETRLRIVDDYQDAQRYQDILNQDNEAGTAKRQISDTIVSFHVRDELRQLEERESRFCKKSFSREERNIACKLGSFFDLVQKNGYGKGPPLVLKLRRASAISDAYDLLMVPSNVPLDYYRDLRVIFNSRDKSSIPPTSSNFTKEDESEELFELLSNKVFGPGEYNLFTYASEESKCMFLNPETQVHPLWFTFAGIILALAILHQKKMKIKLAACVFKCLLSRELGIDDLHEIDPTSYEKLMWIKKNNVDNRKMKLTFMVRDTVGKVTIETELLQGGKRIAVTERNKYRYIDLVLKWRLAERYLVQLNDFRKGFHSVINPGFLTNFSHKELLSIVKNPPDPEIFYNERDRSFEFEPKRLSRSETW